jgi:hypothetical protein
MILINNLSEDKVNKTTALCGREVSIIQGRFTNQSRCCARQRSDREDTGRLMGQLTFRVLATANQKSTRLPSISGTKQWR